MTHTPPDPQAIPASSVIIPAHPTETTRLAATLLFLGSTGLLLVAWWLNPESRGIGTHQQLGLPACSFELTTGLPCMTCGMTTSFAHTADGSLFTGFLTQPAGAMLALGCALVSLVSLWALISGMSLKPLGRHLLRPRPIILFLVIFFLAWGFTLTRAITQG